LLVPAKSAVSTIEDLVGRKLGVQQGSTGAQYAHDNAPKGVELVSFPSDAEIYPALQAGTVDAVLQDLPINLEHTDNGAYTIAQQYDTGERYGFAVKKKGNEALLAAINTQLGTLRSDGQYQKLYDKYFGVK
jgi:polar amino acid transport system substrate-binding protein